MPNPTGRAAVLREDYGHPYVVGYKNAVPKPGPLEVLVHIEVSGVCYGDVLSRRRAAGTGAGTAAVDRGPRGRRGGCGFGGGSGGSDGAYGGGSRWPGVAAFDVRALRALRERCGDGVREPGDPWAERQRDISRWGPRWSRTRPNKLLT